MDGINKTQGVRRVALTGGIASGKSLVGEYLKQNQISVIDADDVVRRLLEEDKDLHTQIRQEFGQDVFTPAGKVDHKQLGQKVFGEANTPKRKLLESWTHPKVREAIERFFSDNILHKLAVAIIPLVFESNLEKNYDEVWLLEVDEQQQLARLMARNHLSEADARARIASQMPLAEKRQRAMALPSYEIIDNNGTPEALKQRLGELLSKHSF